MLAAGLKAQNLPISLNMIIPHILRRRNFQCTGLNHEKVKSYTAL